MSLRSARATLFSLVVAAASSAQSAASPPPTEPLEIAFTSKRDGKLCIWSVRADGSGLRRLTDSGSDVGPAWSPDGRRLAFHSHRSGGWKIWVVEFDDEDQPGKARRLTDSAGGSFRYEYFPCWSPDGKRLAFERWNGERGAFEIHVVDADGSNERCVVQSDGHDRQPNWSPDGKRLVFTSQRDGNAEVYVVDLDSKAGDGAVRNLTGDAAVDYAPAWSRDGKRILFHSDRGGRFASYTMATDGSDVQALKGVTADDHLQGWTDRESNTKSIPYRALRSTAGVWGPADEHVLVTTLRGGDEDVCLVSLVDGSRRVIAKHGGRDFLPVLRPRR